MNKNKNWSGFFTNLLGVILGIMLTFGVNSLWQKREDKKKTKEMLILVRKELEINKEWFKNHEKTIRKEYRVYKNIIEAKDNLAVIPMDTMQIYLSLMGSFSDSQLTTTAWQIFQNSEIIQKMTHKELVIRLTECYWLTNKIQELVIKEYWDKKQKAFVYELDSYLFFSEVLKNKESVYFYTLMGKVDGYNTNFMNIFSIAEAFIDYAIMLLDQHGDYRYDMDEKDKEQITCLEARVDSLLNSKIDSIHQKNDTIVNNLNN